MARPTSLPIQATTSAAGQASLPSELPANPEAPPVPPTEVSFPEDALVHLTGVPGTLPDWLL